MAAEGFGARLAGWLAEHEHGTVEFRWSPTMSVIRLGGQAWFGHGEGVEEAFEAAVVAWEATRLVEN